MIIDLTTGTHTNVPYWQQERLVLKLTTASDHVDLYDFADQNTPIATYLTADGVAEIDITDYVRANQTRNQYALTYEGAGQYWAMSIMRAGLINPEGMIIPPHELTERGVLIVPPSKMIATSDTIRAGFYATQGVWRRYINGQWVGLENGYIPVRETESITISDSGFEGMHQFRIYERLCGFRYATIGWTGADNCSGIPADRVHTWEVRSQEIASVDDYSLMDWDNAYKTIKGREDGFTLFLDDLSAYDMWYYSSILTSNYVILKEIDGVTLEEEVVLDVVGKSVTLPNGYALGKLEVQVKYKRYDAIDL
jgi:hypothetical protein